MRHSQPEVPSEEEEEEGVLSEEEEEEGVLSEEAEEEGVLSEEAAAAAVLSEEAAAAVLLEEAAAAVRSEVAARLAGVVLAAPRQHRHSNQTSSALARAGRPGAPLRV